MESCSHPKHRNQFVCRSSLHDFTKQATIQLFSRKRLTRKPIIQPSGKGHKALSEQHEFSDLIFQCPGDPGPISRPLHLARLAAGFSACSECPHRDEIGSLPVSVVKSARLSHRAELRSFRFTNEIRGIYLNDLTRAKLAHVVESVLEVSAESLLSQSTPPRILVGRDTRPSSADLMVGVVNVLKRWGCDIADLGEVTQPCFEFGVEQFRADLGLLVTGGVEPDAVNGLNVYDRDAILWSDPQRFVDLEQRMIQSANRFSRQSGRLQSVSLTEIYQSKISILLPERCDLRVAFACGDPLAESTLLTCLQRSQCESERIASNFSERVFQQQLHAFRYEVRQRQVDVGFLIRPDAQTIHVIDERGREIATSEVIRLCSDSGAVRIDQEDESDVLVDLNLEDLLLRQRTERIPVVESRNRYWFHDRSPRCDALHVVAQILQKLSNADWPLSAMSQQESI